MSIDQIGPYSYRVLPSSELVNWAKSGQLWLWENNREIDRERVAKLYTEQLKLVELRLAPTLFAPSPIVVYSEPSRPLALLDGQHRLEVLKLLSAAHPEFSTPVFLCTAEGPQPSASEVFERVNSGTPVPAAYYNKRVSAVVSAFVQALQNTYAKAVSKAAHPQRPNFNPQQVRDLMTTHIPFRDAIIDHLVDPETLLALALRENEVEMLVTQAGTRHRTPPTAIERAKRTGFHLGLRDGWPIVLATMAANAARDAGLRSLPCANTR